MNFTGATYTLDKLQPQETYIFRFAAKNEAGDGEWGGDKVCKIICSRFILKDFSLFLSLSQYEYIIVGLYWVLIILRYIVFSSLKHLDLFII